MLRFSETKKLGLRIVHTGSRSITYGEIRHLKPYFGGRVTKPFDCFSSDSTEDFYTCSCYVPMTIEKEVLSLSTFTEIGFRLCYPEITAQDCCQDGSKWQELPKWTLVPFPPEDKKPEVSGCEWALCPV